MIYAKDEFRFIPVDTYLGLKNINSLLHKYATNTAVIMFPLYSDVKRYKDTKTGCMK